MPTKKQNNDLKKRKAPKSKTQKNKSKTQISKNKFHFKKLHKYFTNQNCTKVYQESVKNTRDEKRIGKAN